MRRYILLIALLGLLSFSPAEAFSQAIYGSIFGTIIDPSGTSIPNAKVTVINLSKGTRRETSSNATGNYNVIHLIPDAYALRIAASGFKVLEWKSITVAADSAVHVDAQLHFGTTSEVVKVSAEAPQLKTDRADVAVIFDEKTLQELPLLDRNFT